MARESNVNDYICKKWNVAGFTFNTKIVLIQHRKQIFVQLVYTSDIHSAFASY